MASGSATLPRPAEDDFGGNGGPVPVRRDFLLAPAFLVIALGLALSLFDGGFLETVWYPVALFVLALFVLVLVVAPPARGERSRWFDAACALLGLFTLFSYASMLWADVPADAWMAGNRTLLYLLVFMLVGLRPWPVGAARLAVAFVGFGLAAIAVGFLVVSTGSDSPTDDVPARPAVRADRLRERDREPVADRRLARAVRRAHPHAALAGPRARSGRRGPAPADGADVPEPRLARRGRRHDGRVRRAAPAPLGGAARVRGAGRGDRRSAGRRSPRCATPRRTRSSRTRSATRACGWRRVARSRC